MPIAPYPWHALPRVAASEPAAVAMLRAAHAGVTPPSIAATLSELVGHAVIVEPRRRGFVAPHRVDLGARGTCTLLAREGQLLAVEIEAELALAIVGALAGARGLPRIARDRRVEPEVAGALASVVQHVARATGGDELTVAAIDVTTGELRARLGEADVLTLDATVRLGALKSIARVAVTVPLRAPAPAIEPAAAAIARLGDTPLSLPVVLASGWAPRRELALQVGDVVLVDGLSRGGSCVLAEPGALRGVAATVLDDGRLRLRLDAALVELAAEPSPVETAPREAETMTDPANLTGETMQVPVFDHGNPIAEALADMPVEIRVEAGTVTMPARAWAAMGNGDVVVLDRRVGESVTLRVGGKIVGRGELVDVDGNLGVRLIERAT